MQCDNTDCNVATLDICNCWLSVCCKYETKWFTRWRYMFMGNWNHQKMIKYGQLWDFEVLCVLGGDHGRMGTPVRNNFLSGRPKKMSKGPVYNTKKMSRVVIGCHVAMPRSHWSAVSTPLFNNISQLLRDSFSVTKQPPICEFPSHSSLSLKQRYREVMSATLMFDFYPTWQQGIDLLSLVNSKVL